MTVRRLMRILRHLFCRHDWERSLLVNIATGENLGSMCRKCWKVKP